MKTVGWSKVPRVFLKCVAGNSITTRTSINCKNNSVGSVVNLSIILKNIIFDKSDSGMKIKMVEIVREPVTYNLTVDKIVSMG